MKKIKQTSIVTILLSLIPLLMGLADYHKLPNKMATHFNLKGAANGYLNKETAVIGMPLFFILLELLVIGLTIYAIKRTPKASLKFTNLLFLVPVISILTTGLIIYYNLGFAVNVTEIAMLIVGIVFLLIGNYLPTVSYQFEKQTHPFYRGNEADWNQTKRFFGKTFFFGGILILISILLSSTVALVIMFFTIGIVLLGAYKINHKK